MPENLLQLPLKICIFAIYMTRKFAILFLALMALVACKKEHSVPRETIALVHSIVTDTTTVHDLAANAGWRGADGSIALVGEPVDVALLARRFQHADRRDNVDGRHQRDSLPDFAGEKFDAILDAYNAPYSHFTASANSLDSLREVAVKGALHAWDTISYRSATDHRGLLRKESAKILIYTSSLQARYGLFDVDTLQQLVGGKCHLVSPVDVLIDSTLARGARNIAVWASNAVRETEVWENALAARKRTDVTLAVFTPQKALDVRTQLRDLLRQYQVTGLPLDALIIDDYQVNMAPLQSELGLIRLCGTEEDATFDKMLTSGFQFYNPTDAIIDNTYTYLREHNLFAHRITKPQMKYYESAESESGMIVLVEAASSYVQKTYVPEFN